MTKVLGSSVGFGTVMLLVWRDGGGRHSSFGRAQKTYGEVRLNRREFPWLLSFLNFQELQSKTFTLKLVLRSLQFTSS